jgi:DNA polymerase-3 subunit delta'|tara:strand:+ start:2616 stop:3566 length:951 start_codon:yes stop_codon:yes gene_type:complete
MEDINSGLALPLPWHEAVWADLNKAIEQDRMPHALLIGGPSGIGKQRLAKALAQRLLCSAELNNYACGACKSCQLLSAGFHPDLSVLEPAEEGKDIIIGDVRKLCSTLDKTAQQGGWKVAVIIPGEAMNISASNALLKSLEEPQGKTLLVLVSHRPSLLSATIRSRCQKISLLTPGLDTARQWLGDVSGQDSNIDKALEVAAGRPLLALEYIQSGTLQDQQSFQSVIEAVRCRELSFVDAAQQCSKLNPAIALEWFMTYLHLAVTQDAGVQSNQNVYLFLDRLNHMHQMIVSGSTVNQQLLWEELLMGWGQVFSKR